MLRQNSNKCNTPLKSVIRYLYILKVKARVVCIKNHNLKSLGHVYVCVCVSASVCVRALCMNVFVFKCVDTCTYVGANTCCMHARMDA